MKNQRRIPPQYHWRSKTVFIATTVNNLERMLKLIVGLRHRFRQNVCYTVFCSDFCYSHDLQTYRCLQPHLIYLQLFHSANASAFRCAFRCLCIQQESYCCLDTKPFQNRSTEQCRCCCICHHVAFYLGARQAHCCLCPADNVKYFSPYSNHVTHAVAVFQVSHPSQSRKTIAIHLESFDQ